jgi:hypothetical protein
MLFGILTLEISVRLAHPESTTGRCMPQDKMASAARPGTEETKMGG